MVRVTPPAGYVPSSTQNPADDATGDDSNIDTSRTTPSGTYESPVITLTAGGETGGGSGPSGALVAAISPWTAGQAVKRWGLEPSRVGVVGAVRDRRDPARELARGVGREPEGRGHGAGGIDAAGAGVPAGTQIFGVGDDADALYLIEEGEVDIQYPLGSGELRTVDTVVSGELIMWSALV